MLKAKFGIRGRVLAIALAPSLALLSTGAAASVYLFEQGAHAQNWASSIRAATTPGLEWVHALQQERRLTLLLLTGVHPDPTGLAGQRQRADTEFQAVQNVPPSVQKVTSVGSPPPAAVYAQITAQITAARHSIDTGQMSAQAAYDFYSQLIGLALTSMNAIGQTSPDPHTAVESGKANGLFYALEAMLRSSALAAVASTKEGMTPAQLIEFNHEVGFYHAQVADIVSSLGPDLQIQLQALTTAPSWARLTALENAIQRRGATAPAESNEVVDVRSHQADMDQIATELDSIWNGQYNLVLRVASAAGDRTARDSVVGGGAAIAVGILAFLVALWLSGRLVGRLRRLRGETLALADEQLPRIMAMMARGEHADAALEVAKLDYGGDEIGEVAEAFNRAQGAAIAAAVTEAKTREGVKAVFLNIARRSQVVVHKQLEILDRVEYETEDPKQLGMLFRLDHLATRERRNAENLVILGGEQPGRRWRSPVSLVEIVRSAIAETEDYSRVRSVHLPQLLIIGAVVADVVHLIAELVDNATSFSPPESRVEVTGNVVGRGVVVEICDQGLGMTADELARVNETLRKPPDFSVDTLSSDSRLGLFVVARLAIRNEISVRMVESDYGGVRAIVVIPTALIAAQDITANHGPGPDDGPSPHRRVRIPAEDPPAMTGEGPPAPRISIDGLSETSDPAAERRPGLPRRSRQTHLAPQLMTSPTDPDSEAAAADRPRSAEQARDLLSAIEAGTRQGRHEQPESGPASIASDQGDDRW